MTYSPYGEIDDLTEEDDERFLAEQAQVNEMEAATEAKYKAIEAKENEEQEAAIAAGVESGPTLKPTDGKDTAKPKPEQQQQKPEEKKSGGAYGWGANPAPEDRWNIRNRAPVKSELEGLTDPLTAAEAVAAPAAGTLDGFIGMYNTFAPTPDIPKLPQFQDKNLEVIRNVSSFIGPQLVGVGAIHKLGKAAQAAKFGPVLLQKLGTNPVFQLFATAGADMGVGALVDTGLAQDDDQNIQEQVRALFKTPEDEKLFGIFPSSWSTGTTNNPDERASRIRNEGMGLGFFSGVAEGLVKIVAAAADTTAATRFLPRNVAEQEYLARIANGDEFTNVKYSDDPIQDSILRSEARTERSLDELGEYYIAKANEDNIANGRPFQTADELEFEGPVKGIHDQFDQTEKGVINPSPDGVPGAMVDAARIHGDIQTGNGRLGSMTSDAAMKYGLEATNLEKGLLVHTIMDRIKKSGKFDYMLNGKVISAEKIDAAGTWLAEEMINMNPGQMNELLAGFKTLSNDKAISIVDNVGYDAVMKSLKMYMDTFLEMDAVKARALLTTSYAGQASDLAGEWARVSDVAAVTSARNMVMDRMEFLMVHKALAAYDAGSALQAKNVWQRIASLADKKGAKDYLLEQQQAREKYLGQLIPNVKGFTTNLIQIMEEKPQFMKPLFEAYHLTDGKVSSMYDLNRYVYENLGAIQQAFVRGEDTMPNLIVSGMWSNYYNSILSATATPVRALVGNLGGIIARPITTMTGILMEGDLSKMSRAAYQYAGVKDAIVNASRHMAFTWRKTMENPMSTMSYGKGDLVVQNNEKTVRALRSAADAMAEDGHLGPQYLLQTYENMNDIALSPWMRYSANAMTAMDAFTRGFIATAEARGMAYDKILKPGKKIKPGDLKAANEEAFKSLHNAKGWISDSATDYYTGEIALNLDSPLARGMSTLIQNQPWLKPILLFPRTSVNVLSMFAKYSPLALATTDFWDLVRFGDTPPLQHVEKFLTKKGIPFDNRAMETFHQMRREAKGRIAIGSSAALGISMMVSEDRIRGTGHWDKEVQRVRTDNGWVGKTYKGLDGKWHTYEWLGPVGDWISVMTDIRDNFDTIGTAPTEKLVEKMGYILASAITDRSLMAQVEPLGDIMGGNGAAANRFAANMINGSIPYAGLRGTFSRLMTDGLKEVDNELTQLIRNKNNFVDGADPDGALGAKHSWVDDENIGHVDGWMQRAANAFLGYRMADKISENRQFLIDIEFDVRPAMQKSEDGIAYSSHQRSAIFDKMGEQGHFKREIAKLRIERGEAYLKHIRSERAAGRTSVQQPKNFMDVHGRLQSKLREAKAMAIAALNQELKEQIGMQEYVKRMTQRENERGTITADRIDQYKLPYF